MVEISEKVNPALLLTGAIGIAPTKEESSVKLLKNVSSVNPMDDETVFYCKRELGDIMWYWINSCPFGLNQRSHSRKR